MLVVPMFLRTIFALSSTSTSTATPAAARIAAAISMTMTTLPSSSSTAVVSGRVAIAQLRSTNNKQSNLIHVAKCAGWAKRHGAQMLFLPECLGFMGENAEQTLKEADPPIVMTNDDNDDYCCTMMMSSPFRLVLDQTITNAEGGDSSEHEQQLTVAIASLSSLSTTFSIIDELRYIAYKSKLWISGGGVHTRVKKPQSAGASKTTSTLPNPDPDTIDAESKIYNTHAIIDDRGNIRASYHKIHLFDVSIPNKVDLRESNTTAPGTKLVACDSPIGKLGLSICYDMRFAEMYVELVQKRGAQVLLMPSAFTVPTGRAHWHALLRARAIENQCYVIAAAQVGKHNEKRESYGHSVVYDPWGELLVDAGGFDGAGSLDTIMVSESCKESPVSTPRIVIANIDLLKLEAVRQSMPIQRHRDAFRFSG